MEWVSVQNLKQEVIIKMKLRVKFSKHGVVKFVGHLDMMRFFQKAFRRAGIDMVYTGGFSPHQVMSFAAPLGVGYCSNGEYLDIEVNSHNGKVDMIEKLNQQMVNGIRIENIVALNEKAQNAMASVAAASYTIEWKEGYAIPENLISQCRSFYDQEQIIVEKKTKKNTLTINLKPGIFELEATDSSVYMLVDASSSGNIKPTALMEALYDFMGLSFDAMSVQITREETYTKVNGGDMDKLCPLDSVGADF